MSKTDAARLHFLARGFLRSGRSDPLVVMVAIVLVVGGGLAGLDGEETMKLLRKTHTKYGTIAVFRDEEGLLFGSCLDLDLCGQGDTVEETIQSTIDCCEIWMEYGEQRRFDIELARRIAPPELWEQAQEKPRIPLWMD